MYNQTIPEFLFSNKDTFDEYHLGVLFRDFILKKEYFPYQFNGWQERKFYGILDSKKNIIVPIKNKLSYHFNSINRLNTNIPPVTDAFNELKNYYQEITKLGKVKNISPYVALEVFESTSDADELYVEYVGKLFNIFLNANSNIIKNKVSNVNDFIKIFINFMRTITAVAPINKSSFFKSHMCPDSINGLRITIADVRKGLSVREKTNLFMNSAEFNLFVDNAAKFGFFVDKNQPWTIVADIESDAFKKYLTPYGLNSTEQFFDNFYYRVLEDDIFSLKNVFLYFWNATVSEIGNSIITTDLKHCKSLFAQVNSFKELTSDMFDKYFPTTWLIRLYLYFRIQETDNKINQNKFESLFHEACNINQAYGILKCSLFINEKMLEISYSDKQNTDPLTNGDAIYTLLRNQKFTFPTEGINF